MPRTSPNLTQKEIDAFQVFCTEHRIICDDSEAGNANGNVIGEYIAITWGEDITPATLAVALEKLKDRLVFYTPAQIKYEIEYKALSKENQQKFGAWWFSPSTKRSLVIDGEEGFSNAAQILNWCRGRGFSDSTFNLAVSNLAGSRGQHLVHQSTYRPGRHTGGDSSFMKKSDTNLSTRDHVAKRAADAAAAAGKAAPTPMTDYKALAEAITVGRTHSDCLRLQRLFVMKPGTSDIDWQATHAQRQRIADGKGRR